jgi:hypothetical protein
VLCFALETRSIKQVLWICILQVGELSELQAAAEVGELRQLQAALEIGELRELEATAEIGKLREVHASAEGKEKSINLVEGTSCDNAAGIASSHGKYEIHLNVSNLSGCFFNCGPGSNSLAFPLGKKN